MTTPTALVLACALLALNAFFVGAEFALLSARRAQVEPRAQNGSWAAARTLRGMGQMSLVMAGAQLGITACSLALGAVAEPAIADLIEPGLDALGLPDGLLHPLAFAIAMAIVVYLHVVLGEMVPKNIALAGPDRAALVLGPVMVAVVTLLRPVVAALNGIANAVLWVLRVQPRDEVASAFTREQVVAMVEQSHGEGLIEEGEYGRLAGALGFTEKSVAAVVMPWDSLEQVEYGATAGDVEQVCAATGFSRFPVVDDRGRLLGYLHIKDVIATSEERRQQVVGEQWIRPLPELSPDDQLHDALETLQRRGAHMGQVVTRDGGLVGLVALEDVLEELVGQIRDAAHHDEAL